MKVNCGLYEDKRGLEQIVERYLAHRDPGDFQELVREHLSQVRRIIHRIVLCPDQTDDLVQETFLLAFSRMDQFRNQARFSTWLIRIAINVAVAYLRREKTKDVSPLDDLVERRMEGIRARGGNPYEVERVHRAMARLPERYRTVLILVVVEELGTDEVAIMLNCTKATLYWRVFQAKKLLMHHLGGDL